jgi:hypothetical protein
MRRRNKTKRKLFAGNAWFDQLYRSKCEPGWKPPTADEIAEFLGEPTEKQKREAAKERAGQRGRYEPRPVHPGRFGYDPLDKK